MDGKALLLGFAALCGLAYFLSVEGISIGSAPTGPSDMPRRLAAVVDLRHANIRADLLRDGYDLTDPASFVFERDGVEIVGGPVAATEHGAPVFLEQLFPWYLAPAASDLPGRILPLPVAQDCRIARPVAGARVANLWAGPTLNGVSLYAHTEAELDRAALRSMSDPRRTAPSQGSILERFSAPPSINAVPGSRATDALRLTVMEVAITETAVPVHLVLQTAAGKLLWNLSLAPGARIAGVTMLGGEIVALSNLPPDVPVEAMTAAELAACAPPRIQRPLASDPLLAAVGAGTLDPSEARTALEARAAAAENWNRWFASLFGVRDDATRIGHDIASIAALVGPVPGAAADKVGYHGIKGRTVRIAPDVPTIVAMPDKAGARWHTRVGNRARALGAGAAGAERTN